MVTRRRVQAGNMVKRWRVRAGRIVWWCALAASLASCATSSDRAWEKAGATSQMRQRDDAECLTVAGLERVPQVYAGSAAAPGRETDASGRGYAAYVSCMEARGYTRPAR
jgi:hypothetical protein